MPREAELPLVLEGHRRQAKVALAIGECVAEPSRGTEGRRPGRDDTRLGMVVRGNLEQFRGIPQSLDLVDDDSTAGKVSEKPPRDPPTCCACLAARQSTYSTSGRDRQRKVLPTRRTPESQTTDLSRQRRSITSIQYKRRTI